MKFRYNDGGRSLHFKGAAGDCVVRAVSIAGEMPYDYVYEVLANGVATQRKTKHSRSTTGRRSARNGISVRRKWFKDAMASWGFRWVPTMGIGTGCKVHLAEGELPKGRLVVAVSKHYTAVVDGVLQDTYDCSRGGTRCVYGYWTL